MFFDQKSLRHPEVGFLGKSLIRKKTVALFKIASLQTNVRNTFFNQKSPQHQEVGVLGSRAHVGRGVIEIVSFEFFLHFLIVSLQAIIRNMFLTRSHHDIKTWVFWAYLQIGGVNTFFKRKKRLHLKKNKLCHCTPIVGIYCLTRSDQETRKWVFWNYAHLVKMVGLSNK